MSSVVVAAAAVLALSAAPAPTVAVPVTGYQQAQSPVLSVPPGEQTNVAVACPGGTRVIGGGGVLYSGGLRQNIATSEPANGGRAWTLTVTNTGRRDGTVQTYAVCAQRPAGYAIVTSGRTVSAGSQRDVVAECPGGTVAFGGGGSSNSTSTAVNLGSSVPTAGGWRVTVNNASTTAVIATASVVCARMPLGYRQVVGTTSVVMAGRQGSAASTCPTGTRELGGGVDSSSHSTAVNLNTTVPDGAVWRAYVDNGDTRRTTLTPYAVCAEATD